MPVVPHSPALLHFHQQCIKFLASRGLPYTVGSFALSFCPYRAAALGAHPACRSELDLATIAHELDAAERELMGGGGIEGEFGNLDDSGMFSSQARGRAGR